MAGTTLSDVIVPEIFNPYVIQRTMELSALYQSGIVSNNAEFDRLASEAAPMHNMPFFEDLTGESENVVEGADLTANKITSSKDVSVTIRRAAMWSATDLSAALAGSDPMQAIANLVAGYWARDMQKTLIHILKGVFAAGTMTDHVMNISTQSGAKAQLWLRSGCARLLCRCRSLCRRRMRLRELPAHICADRMPRAGRRRHRGGAGYPH